MENRSGRDPASIVVVLNTAGLKRVMNTHTSFFLRMPSFNSFVSLKLGFATHTFNLLLIFGKLLIFFIN